MNKVTYSGKQKRITITFDDEVSYVACRKLLPDFFDYYKDNLKFKQIEKIESEKDIITGEETAIKDGEEMLKRIKCGNNLNVIDHTHKIMRVVKKWYTEEFTTAEYKTPRYKELKRLGVIPMQYIQQRVSSSIKDVRVFKETIEYLVNSDILLRLDRMKKDEIAKTFNWSRFDSDCFLVHENDYKK
jgi:hypothetical protein